MSGGGGGLLTGDGVGEPVRVFGDERVLDVPPSNAVCACETTEETPLNF